MPFFPDPKNNIELEKSLDLIAAIVGQGFQACIVGGAVRDLVVGRPIKDIDIATDMPEEQLRACFPCYDIGRGKDFGLVLVRYAGASFEVARFRGNEEKMRGSALADIFAADAARRDFTINAMALTAEGVLLDPWHGLDDLERRLLRAVGRPEDRIEEDCLRMLRAARFAAQFDLTIEPALAQAIRRAAGRILQPAKERVTAEILKMAAQDGSRFAAAIEQMDQLGLLSHVLPEIDALKGLEQEDQWHPEGDVFEHTLCALRANRTGGVDLNLAILCHDLGKATTHNFEDGRHRYLGHDHAGDRIIETMARRLGLGGALEDRLRFVATQHMRTKLIAEMKPSKVQALIDDPQWELLKAATLCDTAASGNNERFNRMQQDFADAEKGAFDWREKHGRTTASVLSGEEIMAATGLPPGPRIGELMRAVTEWALNNQINDRNEWLAILKEISSHDNSHQLNSEGERYDQDT